MDDECRGLFEYLRRITVKYQSPPSPRAVKDDNPKFDFEYTDDSLEYLMDKFVRLAKRRLASQMVEELAEACNDPERAENIDLEFLEVSRKLATLVPATEVGRFKDAEQRVKEYEERKREGKKFGVLFGYETIDAWTGGMQAHEYATVAGFTGQGKSTFLQHVEFNVFAVQKKTPLIISLEMERGAMLRKFDAMAGNLDYQKMKLLELPDDQMKRWKDHAQRIKDSVADIPVIDTIRHCTPDHVFAEAVRYKPDLIVIDYIQLMRSSRASRNSALWQSVTEVTQDLKQIARTLKIPILAAAQTNRDGAKQGAELDNIGQSISIIQDSDLVIGLFQDEEMRERKEMEIRLRKNRDGKIGQIRANWDHDAMNYREKTLQQQFGRPGDKENGIRPRPQRHE